ncbi:MAG: glycosyltransferase [Bacteroidota bacterium]
MKSENTKLLFVYQNYYNVATALGLTFKRIFNEMLTDFSSFRVKPISNNIKLGRVLNRIRPFKQLHFQSQNEQLINRVKREKPDVLFIIKGTDIKPQTLRRIRTAHSGITLACFNPDDPFNPASSNSRIVESIALYDHYFIWANRLVQPILDVGAKACTYLPFGTDTKVIFPIEKKEFRYDLTFVGSGDNERYHWIKQIVKESKASKTDFNISIFGNNWPKIPGVEIFTHVDGLDFLERISYSRVNLNILRKQNKGSNNMRTFEIPAAGGFMLHEYSNEAITIFDQNKEAVYFKNPGEVVEQTKYYLENEFERKKIAMAGFKKAINFPQTYEARIQKILEKLTVTAATA